MDVQEDVERLNKRIAERVRHTVAEWNAECGQYDTDAAEQQYDGFQKQEATQYLDAQCGVACEAEDKGECTDG